MNLYEEEELEMEVNRLGRAMLYVPTWFHEQIARTADDTRERLMHIISHNPLIHYDARSEFGDFVDDYVNHVEGTCQWQEDIPDKHLVELLPIFRALVLARES